jgi:cytochrome c-type biogenesis protein CcmH/NrfG
MDASIATTRRETVVRGFFWALLVTVSLLSAYFLITGGTAKRDDRAHETANVQQQIAQLSAVLQSNPNDLQTLISLGDLYLNTNNIRDAYQIFLRAEKVDPENVHVLSDLGGIYQQVGSHDKALDAYQRAYRIDPGHGSLLLNMALIYSRHKGDTAKALELLEQFLAGNPDPQMAATARQEIDRIRQESAGSGPVNGD